MENPRQVSTVAATVHPSGRSDRPWAGGTPAKAGLALE